MSNVIIPQRFWMRRGTESALTAANEVLHSGELCVETDTGRFKIGDGTTAWNSLLYSGVGRFDLTLLDDGDVLVWDAYTQTWIPSSTNGGIAASLVSIVDAGGYFTSTDVEGALQELGAGGGGGGGSTDPYWFGVVSQLDAAGADASTTIHDVLGKPWTANGNAQVDTSLGYNTLLFDGNDFIDKTAGYDPNFDWGEGDWCAEFWLYPTSVTGFQNIARRSLTSNFSPFSIALNGANLRTRCSENGAEWKFDVTGSVTIATGALVHIAICRQGANFYQYVDGVADGTATFTGGLMTSTQAVYIGAQSDAAGGYTGHVRAARFTKGNCRYPGGITFTPEAAPFWTP